MVSETEFALGPTGSTGERAPWSRSLEPQLFSCPPPTWPPPSVCSTRKGFHSAPVALPTRIELHPIRPNPRASPSERARSARPSRRRSSCSQPSRRCSGSSRWFDRHGWINTVGSSRARLRPGSLVEQLRDLPVGGESLQRRLREDQAIVHRDLEDSAPSFDELDVDAGKGGLQFGGQTGRLRQVGSLHAVLDRDLHSVGSGDWG